VATHGEKELSREYGIKSVAQQVCSPVTHDRDPMSSGQAGGNMRPVTMAKSSWVASSAILYDSLTWYKTHMLKRVLHTSCFGNGQQ